MTSSSASAPVPPGTRIADDAALSALWSSLLGPGEFGARSLWLVFLDSDDRLLHTIVPIDDIPAEPDAQLVRSVASIAGGLVDDGPVASVAMVLCRPGSRAMRDDDRRWAAALVDALAATAAVRHRRWPIHLATRDHIQVFAGDDLIARAS